MWFTPHIRTLRIGSLARNSFTFWHTKCFFLVLVLLALSGATATAVVLVQLDDMPGAAAAAAAGKVGGGRDGAQASGPRPPPDRSPPPLPHRAMVAPVPLPPHPAPVVPSAPRPALPAPPPGSRPARSAPRPRALPLPSRHQALFALRGWYCRSRGGSRCPASPSSPGLTGTGLAFARVKTLLRSGEGRRARWVLLSTAGGAPCPGPPKPGFGSFPQPDVPRWRRRHCLGGEKGREYEEGGTYHPHPGEERRNTPKGKGSPAGNTKERPLAPPKRGSSHSPGPRARCTRGTRPFPPGPMRRAGRDPLVL